MSLLDKLLGRTAAEPEAAPDDRWMTDEQRNAKLAWWESQWMDRIVAAVRMLFSGVAIAAALGLLGLLGWTLYRTPVPELAGPISIDMTRAASFGMIPIVLGVPIGLALVLIIGKFLFNVIVAIFKSPVHKVFKPAIAPIVSVLLLAGIAWFHQPIHGFVESVYFKIVQTHRLAKTSVLKIQAQPPAATPSTAP
jgi:hypothetical protein